MTNRVLASTLRLAVFAGLAAATLTGALVIPAHAEDRDNRDRRWNESHRNDRPHYYQQPTVYYAPPPVVYAPPGASFNFNFPFYR